MTQRTLMIVIAALVVAVAIGLVVYSITGKRVKDLSPLTVAASQILPQKLMYPALTPDGSRIVYFSDEDTAKTGLFRVNLATKEVELFRSLPKGAAVGWSPDRNQAIISLLYNEGLLKGTRFERDDAFFGAVTVWAYDVASDRLNALPLGTSSTAWDPSGANIYYHYLDLTQVEPTSELSKRETFGAGHEKVVDIPAASSYTMQFLDEKTILLMPNLSDPTGSTTMSLLDLTTKTIQPLTQKVFTASGSPDGAALLYESIEQTRTWHLLERATGKDVDLQLAVGENYAYWLSAEQFLIVEHGTTGSDRLWVVNTQDLTRQEIVLQSDQSLHLESILPAGNSLYFTSDSALYRLDLP